ncbi:HTH-type transcriptional regulator McbR [Ensifer psoraleae]|uniref:GntR family transcriptional regulator n=1 Tax=Sinorhizobium psoraleae TaxID=520838 RepID=UPI0024AB3B28|nr:GntR family transcriptional regulator [Sinorhizobium psoraleae]NRP72167.1 HTH-type transcriptional regulator McbR [Sinorhizobium psoraleae]
MQNATDFALKQIGHLERVTLGERVYSELRQLLMAGKLVPGEKLSLRSVAEALGVSMMPVREAVARLVAEGALTVLPNRAVSVPPMTQSKLRELMRIRIEIEGFAAQEAAVACSGAALKRISDLDAAFRAAVLAQDADVEQALRLNKEFHFAVYEATRLPILTSIIESLWLKIGPVINLDLRTSQRLTTGGAEQYHGALVAALSSRDGKAARKALAGDIRSSSEFILATGKLPE